MIYKYDWHTSLNNGPLPDDDRNCHTMRDAIQAAKQAAEGDLQSGGRACLTIIAKDDAADSDLDGVLVYAAIHDGHQWYRLRDTLYSHNIYTAAQILAALRE